MVQAKHIAHAHVLEGKRFAQIGVPLLVVLVKVEPCWNYLSSHTQNIGTIEIEKEIIENCNLNTQFVGIPILL